MLIYFVVLSCAVLLCFLSRIDKHSVSAKNIFLFALFCLLSLFAGLRDRTVGTDTNSYVYRFLQVVSGTGYTGNELSIDQEPAYFIVQELAAVFSNDYVALLLLTSSIFVLCVLIVLNKLSFNITLSLFTFICLGYYTFCFNAIRQSLALCIYMLSIPFLIKKKFIKYCAIVLLASMFHKTIIIAIPIYFILIMPVSKKSYLIYFIITLVSIVALPSLLQYGAQIEDRYQLYQESVTGGEMLTVFYFLLSAFFIWVRKYIHKENIASYDIYLNMSIMGTIIYLVVFFSSAYVELTRFAIYFQVGAVFLWPYIFKSLKNKHIYLPIYFLFIVGHLAFMYIFINQMADLVPYTVNPNIRI